MIYSICRANDGNTMLFVLMPKNPILLYIIYGVGVTELFYGEKLYIFADIGLKHYILCSANTRNG